MDENKKKMVMYIVLGICIVAGIIIANTRGMRGENEGMISTEYRETRGQRKARVQAELDEKVNKVKDSQSSAADASRRAQERLEKLQGE